MPTPSVTEPHITFSSLVTEHTIPDGGTGDWIEVGPGPVSVTLIPGTSAKLQYTTSRPTKVRGNTAQAIDWANGTVTVPTSDVANGPVTGVRGVSVVGICTLEVVQ